MTEEQVRAIIRDEIVKVLGDYSEIPLEVENALVARGFTKFGNIGTGIVYSTSGTLSTIAGASGSFYTASISGGTVNHFVQVASGVVTSA